MRIDGVDGRIAFRPLAGAAGGDLRTIPAARPFSERKSPLASISSDPSGNRTLQFVGIDGRRRSIRLGKLSLRAASKIKERVEALAAAKAGNFSLDRETAEWLAGVGDDLAARLATAGRAEPRQAVTSAALEQFLKDYRAGRADVAQGTSTNSGIIADRLLAFFPAKRALRAITPGDGDRWLVWLKQNYAGPTVS
jgi:hypothetical protein